MTSYHYTEIQNRHPENRFKDHPPTFGHSKNGSKVSIVDGLVSFIVPGQDSADVGHLVMFKSHGLSIAFRGTEDTLIAIGPATLALVAEMVDHLNEQVKS